MILRCILKCIIKNCKPPQSFDFTETKLLLKFIWFEKVSMSLLSLLDERIKFILCLLLYLLIKIEVLAWNILQKAISNMIGRSEKIQITRELYYCQNKLLSTNQVGIFLKNEANEVYDPEGYFQLYNPKIFTYQKKKGWSVGERKSKGCRGMAFFHFHFLTISCQLPCLLGTLVYEIFFF